LKGTLAEELDFEHEAHNGERCAKDLGHFSYIYVPKINWDLTTKVNLSRGILGFWEATRELCLMAW